MEQSQFATLCTTMAPMHHRRQGYPFGSLVDFAVDGRGLPVFSLSSLAVHTRNIKTDPKCSIQVQAPGWSGLANARLTLFGDVFPIAEENEELAQEIFLEKHGSDYAQSTHMGNSTYWIMANIVDVYFVGGFGTVCWIQGQDYLRVNPDEILCGEYHRTLRRLNERYRAPLMKGLPSCEDINIMSIDKKGLELKMRDAGEYSIRRLSFAADVHNFAEACRECDKILLSS